MKLLIGKKNHPSRPLRAWLAAGEYPAGAAAGADLCD